MNSKRTKNKAKSVKRFLRIVLNLLLVIGVSLVLVNILTRKQDGVLAVTGVRTFRYFTTLSNLLEAIAALLFVIFSVVRRGKPVPKRIEMLKYIASTEIFVTFLTIAAFLAPIYGFEATCTGNNFWFHLVFPVASVLEQIFLSEEKAGWKGNLFAVVPTFVYGCYYVLNIVINGKGTWPDTNDWYGFLNWGYLIGAVIFVSVCLMAFLIGLLLRGLWKLVHKERGSVLQGD